MKQVLGVFFIISAFSACGSKISTKKTSPSVDCLSTSDSKFLVQTASVTCGNTQDCPSSVALLSFQDTCGAGMCTAFLIAQDLAVTNSHCVPEAWKANPKNQKSLMVLNFPSTQNRLSESVSVREIVKWSNISGESPTETGKRPDYALLKLSRPVYRDTLSFDSSGVKDLTKLTLVAVTPQSRLAIRGLLEVKSCQSMMGSSIQPSYDHPETSVISFSDCELIHGNSGSPILGSDGKVKAIAHAALEKRFKVTLSRQLNVPYIDDLNLATNAACLDLPGYAKPASHQCDMPNAAIGIEMAANSAVESARRNPLFQKKLNLALQEKINSWSALEPTASAFAWTTISQDQNLSKYDVIPVCSKEEIQINSEYQTLTPQYFVRHELDTKLRASFNILTSPTAPTTLLLGNDRSTLLLSRSGLSRQIKQLASCTQNLAIR